MRWNTIISVAHLVLLGISPSSAIPNVKRSIIGRAPKQPANEVYRGDFRSPAEVAKDGGFRPRGDYANNDRAFSMWRHMLGEFSIEYNPEFIGEHPTENPNEEWASAYVSVSTTTGEAARFGLWLYRIRATPNMIDPTTEDQKHPEVFALGGVHWEQVMGWYQINPLSDVITAADFTPNPAYQARYDQFALTTVDPESPWHLDRSYWTQFMDRQEVGSAVGFTGQFPLQFGTYSLDGLPEPSSWAYTEIQGERPQPAEAQAPALNEDDIIVAAQYLRDHNAPCDASGVDPQTQSLILEADSIFAQALARMNREHERPNRTFAEADEELQAIIESLESGEKPTTCELVGECSGMWHSQQKRAEAPSGLSKLCQKIHKPRTGANGLDNATQNSKNCVLRSLIKVKVQLSDTISAGSWDRLFLEIGKNPRYDKSQPHYLLKESPSAGDLMSIDVDLADAYTLKTVTINDIKNVRLVSRLDNGREGSNQLNLQDITITAKCAASSKVAEFHKTADAWFTNWGTNLKPTDWSWKKDCDKFKSLKFKWHLGGIVRAGTWDDLKLSSHRNPKVAANDIVFAKSPAASDSGEMEMSLKDVYGSATVPIEKVDYFRVYSTTRWPDSGEDKWEFGGIKFMAMCESSDHAVVLDKFGSDYNWHSRSNGIELPIVASDWRWENENLQTRYPFPREDL
ncbi:heat-labile enterotoxin alpha chain [Metarhizium robertsii]|uniref:Heat-labile enterotoxin IIB, A chain n=2 Tax=Metarhizium robertsii TaxID=568076 RepID=E9EJ41_METRA|nr:heat-labile enterotoxin IIB, A chain [Metarhizium robertsii ARSEF 23]EFZ03318.2 heat-labile enterotoxin IIB, A chain [Metarhizium robertsii ARSEF 23]EXU95018.1 heat-labile enterotoxin alpha chain [Metarhizium robertsii]